MTPDIIPYTEAWSTCIRCGHIVDCTDSPADDQYRCLECDHLNHVSQLDLHYVT